MTGHTEWADLKHKAARREWTVELDTTGAALDVDGLETFAVAIEEHFGSFGPACALHAGELGVTMTTRGSKPVEALRDAVDAIDRTLETIGKAPATIAHASIERASA